MTTLRYKRIALFIQLLAISLFFGAKSFAQSYGLIVSSHETVAENRTSLDLTSAGTICYDNSFELSFDFGFIPNYSIYFGYIFRLINDKNQNIDFIYNQRTETFQVIFGEKFTNINFQLDKNTLLSNWTSLKFSINPENRISCTAGNKTWQTEPLPIQDKCFKLIFGVVHLHDFMSRDTPPMRLRNIRIGENNGIKLFWPLNESTGTTATDSIKNKVGKILNPGWVKPKHSQWVLQNSFSVAGSPSLAFDPARETVYFVGSDSLYTFSARDSKLAATGLTQQHANLLAGNVSLFNPFDSKLYNFYIDQKAVAEYSFEKKAWSSDFRFTGVTEYWHTNKFVTPRNELYTIGGYGQLKYKNTVFRHNLETNSWDTLRPTGDFFGPRYLAGLGLTASADSAYIIGGFGSREGDQVLSPKYYYDFLLYDVRKNSFKTIYTLQKPPQDFVFGNSLVIDQANNCFYAVVFPNDRFNTQIQLIQGSLTEPTYRRMGQPIPYSFVDIHSYTDLFYCPKSQILFAVTLYTAKNNITDVKVYSINFPPNEFIAPPDAKVGQQRKLSSWIYFAAGLVVVAAVVLLFLRTRTRKNMHHKPVMHQQGMEHESISTNNVDHGLSANDAALAAISPEIKYPDLAAGRSKILLFGTFEVVTADGVNITKQFTPLLKEMFLLILVDSLRYHKGVSSEKLNEILWHDKDPKDAKNNRSVNLVKLKNILDKLGGCHINRETGSWKLEFDENLVYIDFHEYLKLFTAGTHDSHALQESTRLLAIVHEGAFLQQTHYQWLDTVKAEISNFVIEYLIRYAQSLNHQVDLEKLNSIGNAILMFDELNEYALRLKCRTLILLRRHTLAKNTFDKFATKYKEIYGEDFPQTYHTFVE